MSSDWLLAATTATHLVMIVCIQLSSAQYSQSQTKRNSFNHLEVSL